MRKIHEEIFAGSRTLSRFSWILRKVSWMRSSATDSSLTEARMNFLTRHKTEKVGQRLQIRFLFDSLGIILP